MKWSIIQLQKYRDKGMPIDETVDLNDIKEIDPQVIRVSPIHVTGRADIASNRVTFHLHIEGKLVLPCSRTLVEVDVPVDLHTIETYLLDERAYDMYEEEEIHRIEGDVIDLKPAIRELLILEIPMQVLSDEAREQNEMPSGKDWEVMTEEQAHAVDKEEEKKVDPRLADLAKLLDQNKKS
ncbi:YceD family protein [Rossellomorea marisflavi]|uniref:YceD family protein n=1 Tax=Rossellomorea marisflavi TaxID=189381 RepID=UPI0027AB08D0|nr:YceD family protein [Rossellomorea marisflavi]UTE71197.1 YceD family protein [Rossellomorea marisflavi]